MKSLNEDLKTGQFKQIYLLYGEEEYLKKQYRDRFIKALLPEGDTMNISSFHGKNVNLREVMDISDTLPFFAERRLIVMENTGVFKNAAPEFADYLKELPSTTFFIFIDAEVDKRNRTYKVVKDKGRIVELKRQDERTLLKWIVGLARQENKKMNESVAAYFLTKVGNDMDNIRQELEKVFCYCLHHTDITIADIDQICTTQITNHIFDMVDAVANKEQKKALDYYYDLLSLKEPPMRILYLLVRQFRILMEIKELEGLGYGPKDMASKAGIMPFVVGKYRTQARAFSSKELRRIVEAGVQTEENVKTGKMNDVLSVELYLVQYSTKKDNRNR